MKKIALKSTGLTMAASAAALLLAGCSSYGGDGAAAPSGAKMADVKCSGINACKGKGACATATHACAGHNSCKGQGWVKASKADCLAKGGKVSGEA